MPREALSTLTEPMYYVLLALTRPLCGIEIMEAVQELSHGRLSIGPGTLYTMLAKFEDNGLIALIPTSPGESGKRKSYEMTEKGAALLRQEYSRLKRQAEDGKAIMEEMT
ncbi:MAG: helix-turn-helix transcriptional regulator [Clostridia bacterium]|nr:helix-turn-helix transcriptional regulator [Clostridia bacterium]